MRTSLTRRVKAWFGNDAIGHALLAPAPNDRFSNATFKSTPTLVAALVCPMRGYGRSALEVATHHQIRAYEAADCGLPSAEVAAGVRRVKGVKKLGASVITEKI